MGCCCSVQGWCLVGLRLGGVCSPLLANRWEEGWTRPLADWRQQLGIADELLLSPFAAV